MRCTEGEAEVTGLYPGAVYLGAPATVTGILVLVTARL